MDLPPLDRRHFLGAGGAAFFCTLAGHKLRLDQPADTAKIAADIKVPPKVEAASQNGAAPAAATTTLASVSGNRREYWIAAEQRKWKIVPTKFDEMMDQKVPGKSKFKAYTYRAYNANFSSPAKEGQIPGPVLYADVGDTLVVHFRNDLDVPVTMHPHGIRYDVLMDGAYKGEYTDPSGFVQPGQEFTYIWEAVEGTEGLWLYHDHGPLDPVPVYKGLFGPLIVRDPGKPQPDVEYFLFFHAFEPVATNLQRQFWCINGLAYTGNTPTLRAKVGQRVAFHMISLDNYFHTFHIHGHRWTDPDGTVIDTKTMGPGESFTFEFVEDNPGRWLYHCHVFSHLHNGMTGWYIVE